jgi:Ras family protein
VCIRFGTGKSAVTIQFSENHFAEAYNPTIENTFHKTLKHKGTEYELEIIDTVRLQTSSLGGEVVLDRCFDPLCQSYSSSSSSSSCVAFFMLQRHAQAGQDEQSIMPFRGTIGIDGYVMVYSVASRTSMETVKVLNEKIINESGTATVPRVLVGNKSDLHNDRSISVEEGKRTAEELNCAFIECSAKHNENICTCTFS